LKRYFSRIYPKRHLGYIWDKKRQFGRWGISQTPFGIYLG
jgi:hypothetical protein